MTEDLTIERNKLRSSMLLPLLFVSLLWIIYLLDITLHLDLARFGTRPRQLSGLIGILTTPLLHANYEHLVSNTIPLILLGTMAVYFYRPALGRLFITLFILGGLWLWVLGMPDQVHIGASGLVYALVSFLFVSGILTRHRGMMAISMLTIFLYSSLALGVIPFLVPENVSWQGHLAGSLAGIVCAFYFKNEGPKREEFNWGEEEENTDDNSINPTEITTSKDAYGGITYHFVEKKDRIEEDETKENTAE